MVSKALSVRRAKAGSLLKTIREVNALKVEENDILVGHGYHTAGSLPPWPLDAVLPPTVRRHAAVAAELHQQQQQSCPHQQQQQQQSCPHQQQQQQQSCPHQQQQQQQQSCPTASRSNRSTATCTSPTTGTSIIGTSAPTTTSPAATLAAATTTLMAPIAGTRPPRSETRLGERKRTRIQNSYTYYFNY